MADSSIDLLALNREILLNPKAAGSNELVALLELEKPGLEFLCPLAKAIYLFETNRPDRVNPSEALLSCAIVDYTFSGLPGSEDPLDILEEVSHTIKTTFGDQEILLRFKSTGGMIYCTGFWSDYLRSAWATKWPLDLLSSPQDFVASLFLILDESCSETSPGAYPTDKGEFLGSMTYALVGINDKNIDGPEYSNMGCEDGWEGLSDHYDQRCLGARIDSEGQMCWLHYIDEHDAKSLGIWAKRDEAIGVNSDYPEWVSKKVSKEDMEATWISPDHLQSSYSQGSLAVEESTSALLAFGCGTDWEPGYSEYDDDQADAKGDELIFDPMTPPLMEIPIQRGANSLPDELVVFVPYIMKLHQMQN